MLSMLCASVLALIGPPYAAYPAGTEYSAHRSQSSVEEISPSYNTPPAPYEGRSTPRRSPQPPRYTHRSKKRKDTNDNI